MGQRASAAAAPAAALPATAAVVAPVAAAVALAVASAPVAAVPQPAPAPPLAPVPRPAPIAPCFHCGARVCLRCCRARSSRLPLAIVSALDADAAHSILALLPLSDFAHSSQVCRQWYAHACTQPARTVVHAWTRVPPVALGMLRAVCLSPLWRGVLSTLELGSPIDRVSLFDLPALHGMRSLRTLSLTLGMGARHAEAEAGPSPTSKTSPEQLEHPPNRSSARSRYRCQPVAEPTARPPPTTLDTLANLMTEAARAQHWEQTSRKLPAKVWARAFPASLTELCLDFRLTEEPIDGEQEARCFNLILAAACDASQQLTRLSLFPGDRASIDLRPLLSLPALTQLMLGFSVSLRDMQLIKQMPRLRHLSCTEVYKSEPCLTELLTPPHALTQLETLHWCREEPDMEGMDAELMQLLAGLPHLTDFGMLPCSPARRGLFALEASQLDLLRLTPRLRRLYIVDDDVSDDELQALLRELEPMQLHTLRLDANGYQMQGSLASLLLPRLPQLTVLILASDDPSLEFVSHLPLLEQLFFSTGGMPDLTPLVQLQCLRRLHLYVQVHRTGVRPELPVPAEIAAQLLCYHLIIVRFDFEGRNRPTRSAIHTPDSECCLTKAGELAQRIRVGRPRECRLEHPRQDMNDGC